MRSLRILVVGLAACLSIGSFHGLRAAPGAGTSDGAVGERFDVEVRADRSYGVIPFEVAFRVQITDGMDTIEGVSWDFESDGVLDATGPTPLHVFEDPIDYVITADIITTNHGTLTRTTSVSGHSALMTLNFDDGHESVYQRALPLLESKGITATAYIVPSWIGETWYMRWSEVLALQEAGWDIGSHSMTHPWLTEVDDSTLHYELAQSKLELQSRGFAAEHFALPYNDYDDRVMDAVELYYESARIGDGLNPGVEEADAYGLFSYTSLSWRAFSFYRAHIDSAIANRGWYILNNHKVVTDCMQAIWCIDVQMLEAVIDYAIQNRVKIVKLSEALGEGLDATSGVVHDAPTGAPAPISIDFTGGQLTSVQPEVEIRYTTSLPGHVEIVVYDPLGRRVRTLVDAAQDCGTHSAFWGGVNQDGVPVASGIYFCAFKAGNRFGGMRRIAVIR
jgi:peptidoglycan/xylan/chitin deacetylase (PgdA/CDA1 family)